MHEMSIAQSMIEIIREEMRNNCAKSLKSVRIEIGTMSAIVPDSLSFCFELSIKETELEDAELIIDVIPLTGFCHSCEQTFEIKDYAFECFSCGSTNIEIIAGRELSITELEVE